MLSQEYRSLISKMIRNGMKKKFPGLKKNILDEAATEIARTIHARFYGADVDGVGSPIWRDHITTAECNRGQPTLTANEILNEEIP